MSKVKVSYTLSEYAAMVGMNLNTVRRRADRGTLPTQKEGGRRVIYLDDLVVSNPSLFASIVRKLQIEKAHKRGS